MTTEDGHELTLEERLRIVDERRDLLMQLEAGAGFAGVPDVLRLALELMKNGVTESDVVPMLRASHVDGFADVTLQDAVAAAKTRDAGKDGVSVVSVRLRQIAATLTSPGEVDTLLYAADQLIAPRKTTALAEVPHAYLIADLRGLADVLTGFGNRATLRRAADALAALSDTVPREQAERAARDAMTREAHLLDERDALAAREAQVLAIVVDALANADDSGVGWDAEVSAAALHEILDTAPAISLAQHDAEVWERGRAAGGSVAMRRMSDEPNAPDAVNPYRAAAAGEEQS